MLTKNEMMYVYGEDYVGMTVRLLRAADLAGMIGDRNARIALKPNLVIAGRAEDGGVTHPEIVDGILTYLDETGFRNVIVIEGSWVGDDTDRAFRVSGIGAACEKHGVPYYNTKKDNYITIEEDGHKYNVTERLKDIDWLINLPLIKGHCQTLMTCSLKNHKGLISDPEKRRFHSMGLHRPIAGLAKAVTKRVKEFIVVDNICGDLDFEEGGRPVYNGRILCGTDPVLCDAYALDFMGYTIDDVPYVRYAWDAGVGNGNLDDLILTDIEDVERANEYKANASAKPSRRVQELAIYTDAIDACSACYGNLIGALDVLDAEDLLAGSGLKVAIGQGHRDEKAAGIGVGACTAGFAKSCPGCPPSKEEMISFLRNLLTE